nr:TPA_asm: m44.7 sORF 5 [Murid betaherpesvirus 1]DBA07780.1 TPA_asm: m44.7 sORF 5 [Murid betaherpesvirus 1]
MRCAMASTTMP